MIGTDAFDREGLGVAVGLGLFSAVLFLAVAIFPVVGIPLSLFSAVPIAVAAQRMDLKRVCFACLAGTALIFGAGDAAAALMFICGSAAAGYVLGLSLRKDFSPDYVVGGYAALAFAAFWIGVFFIAREQGVTISNMLFQTFERSIDDASAALLKESQDQEVMLAVQNWASEAKRLTPEIFPGLLAVFCVFTGWANALLVRRFRKCDGVARAWISWRAPERLIWVLIASGLAALLAPGGIFGKIAINIY